MYAEEEEEEAGLGLTHSLGGLLLLAVVFRGRRTQVRAVCMFN